MPSSPDDFRLRAPELADAPALGRMHAQAWREAYGHVIPAHRLGAEFEQQRLEGWQQLLSPSGSGDGGPRLTLAERAGRVLGFAGFGPARDPEMPREHELWFVYVLREAHGTGLALRLVEAVDPEGSPAYLWVFCDNARAMAFYRKLGFAIHGEKVPLKTLTDTAGHPLYEIRMVR